MFNKCLLAIMNSCCHWHNFFYFLMLPSNFSEDVAIFIFGFSVCIYNASIKINCKKEYHHDVNAVFFILKYSLRKWLYDCFWLDRLEELFSLLVNQRLCA